MSKTSQRGSAKSPCPSGYIRRAAYDRPSYIRKNGTTVKGAHVKASCIRQQGLKTKSQRKSEVREYLRRQEKAAEITKGVSESEKKCKKGEILRAAYMREGYTRDSYVRKSGTRVRTSKVGPTAVPAKCIKAVSHTGKKGLYDEEGKRVIVLLEKGALGKYGYHDVANLTIAERRTALDKAVAGAKGNWLSIFRRLNIQATYNKYKNPTLHDKFIEDRDYVKAQYAK
jgi:hypothetical protein